MESTSDETTNSNENQSNNIVGDYIVGDRLGGEHSSTFRGVNKNTQEIVAIKVFDKSSSTSMDLYEAEINAYESLKGLSGILQLREHVENNQFHFIITDFIEEDSLRIILNRYSEGMKIEDVLQLFTPIAEAIDRIHGKNIIHRDLKPENILVRKVGHHYEIFVTDFGVVKFTGESQQFQTEHTAGTSWYIAPEALFADPTISQTKAVDIYALGVMLYEALEGKMPFNHPMEALEANIHFPERTKRKTNADVVKYLLKPLNKDPEQRPKSAREVIRTIRNADEGNLSTEEKWEGNEFKDYVVEKLLGTGKMGTTLRARDRRTNKQVVLKAFQYSPFGNPIQAFNNEIKSLERLEDGHGALTPRDNFEQDGIFFIVTDYQSGGTLRHLMNRRPRSLSTKEILEIFTQLAETIDYIHENKIIHRDIKPENVVFNNENGKINVFLTDFGISVVIGSAKSSFHTEHGAGTYRYMAPELWKPKAKKTKAVDIYSFGIMLYEALEGDVPFDAEHPAIINQHLHGEVPAPKNTLEELGPDAKNILLQALAKNPEERPKTATEIVQQIKGQYTKFLGKEFGKYTIDKFIGRGAYGATYRAHDTGHKRKKFALKILSVSKPNMHELGKLKELGKINGILPIIEGGSDNDIHYIVTEYLYGNSLRDMLQNYSQGLGLEETLRIFRPIAKALDALHQAGAIHGDLKPENIVFQKNKTEENSPQPLITDYGISKLAGKTQTPYFKIDILAGNFAYMAPEVWEDHEPSAETDIYAFGVMLYEALEGALPFNATSLFGIMKQHLSDRPPFPKNLSKQTGPRAVDVLLRSLDKKPERRQKSALELISQLDNMAHEQTTTGAGSISEPLTKPIKRLVNRWQTRRYPRLTTAILLGSLAMIGLSSMWYFQGNNSRTPEPPTPTSSETSSIESPPTEVPDGSTVVNPLLIPITSRPPLCIQYPPNQSGWDTNYRSTSSITLEKLYRDTYGLPRDFDDIYALAYYNNRKALENRNMYASIDPEKLSIQSKDQTIFLPPPAWIDKYREFPVPILEITQDKTYTSLDISGSSVLDALSSQIVKCFDEATNNYAISLGSKSTAVGLFDYCQGNADIVSASEEITPNLMDENGCSGINFLKFEVASDSIVIFINENNPYADDLRESPLTRSELRQLLFSAASWKDVRSTWGDEPINRYYPSTKGGSFEIVRNELFPGGNASGEIPNLSAQEGDGDYFAVGGVINDPLAIGFSRYGPYQINNQNLIALPIDNISPISETIQGESPTYPLTRSLYLYTGESKFNENPLLRYFINYYLAYELDYLDELGYLYPDKESFLNDQYFPRPK